MRGGSLPKVCYWCGSPRKVLESLFVNGHGWTDICGDCQSVIEPVPAALASAPKMARVR
ncbi:MAG: hypothetical protein V4522_08105 [Pseudomonadota bacterium]|jgi:hypothetical protein